MELDLSVSTTTCPQASFHPGREGAVLQPSAPSLALSRCRGREGASQLLSSCSWLSAQVERGSNETRVHPPQSHFLLPQDRTEVLSRTKTGLA